MSEEVLKESMLFKKGHRRHNWNERFFELTKEKLTYFTANDKRQRKGHLSFSKGGKLGDIIVQVTPHGSRKTGSSAATEWRFTVSCWGDSIMMAAHSEEEMNSWVLAIQRAVSATNKKRFSLTELTGDFNEDERNPFERTTSVGDPLECGVQNLKTWHHASVRKAGVLWKRGQASYA